MATLEIETNYHFDKINDFFNFFAPWNNNDVKNYIFRGHSKASYKLIPSVLRPDIEEKLWSSTNFFIDGPIVNDGLKQIALEKIILREFYKKTNEYGLFVPISPSIRKGVFKDFDGLLFSENNEGTWINTELLEVASLAQHYGLPTRLLDWTFDPFIAIFFALHSALYKEEDDTIKIWCLNKNTLSVNPFVNFYVPHYDQNSNITAQKGLFSYIPVKDIKNISNIEKEINLLSTLDADRIPLNEYLKSAINNIQNDEILKEDSIKNSKIFISVTLPYSLVEDAFKTLNKFGYTSGRVFPGYEGVVKEMFDIHQQKKSS